MGECLMALAVRRAILRIARLIAIGVICAGLAPAHASQNDEAFLQALSNLATSSFREKQAVIEELAAARHPSTRQVLAALLEGNLYYRREDTRVFIVSAGDTLELTDPVTLRPAGTADAADFARITTNNQLRRSLRSTIAGFDLSHPDSDVRLAAVNELLRSLDEDGIAIVRQRVNDEKDPDVRDAMKAVLAMADLESPEAGTRLAAVGELRGNLSPHVYNRLRQLTEQASDGSWVEPDQRVRSAALSATRHIENWRTFYGTIETLFFGLSLGSVLVLVAIGLAITFGVMGVINMAHGELMMLGAYTTYTVQLMMPGHIGMSILVAIPAAFLVAGGVGVLIERGLVRFLYGRPLETLLATFGVSLILQQVVRDIFSANNRPVETPQWMAGSWQINEALSITYNRLYVVVFTLIVFAILLVVLKRTTLGLKVRAVAQNRAMARAMGVRTEWVDAMTFGLGSGIAGVAGVALSQLTNVGPNLGQQYI
ncbi:MAG TPA: urea ABC transporter permease subunit UrtB, partial [Steroidobacteraceae bacterium]